MTALLEARDLCKRFGGLVVTDHCRLSIADGETHAVIGPNGAGKTTLIAQLSGALACDEGEVWFAGRNVTGLTMHARVVMGLARSYQITSLFPGFTVRENLETGFAVLPHGRRRVPDEVFELFPVLKTMLRRRGG